MGSQRRQWAASGAAMPKTKNSSWKDVPWDDDTILQESCRQNLVSRDPPNIKLAWRRWMAEHAASGSVRWDDHSVQLNQSTGEVVDQSGKKVSEERKTIGNVVPNNTVRLVWPARMDGSTTIGKQDQRPFLCAARHNQAFTEQVDKHQRVRSRVPYKLPAQHLGGRLRHDGLLTPQKTS